MSFSGLLADNPNKSWSNLFANSLTIYRNLIVKGSLSVEEDADVTHNGDVTIKGKLTLDNSNNQDSESLQIIGLKNFETDGFITTHSSLQVDNIIYSNDALLTGDMTVQDITGREAIFSGPIRSTSSIHEQIYTGTGSAPPGSGEYYVRFVENGGLVTAYLIADDFEFTSIAVSDAGFTPNNTISDDYLPSSDVDITCWMKDNGGVSIGIIRLKSDGRIEMGPGVIPAGISTFDNGTVCGPWSNCCISYYSKRLEI